MSPEHWLPRFASVSCRTAENDSGRMLFGDLKLLPNLTPGDHAGFVENQDLRAGRRLGALVVQEPLDRSASALSETACRTILLSWKLQ
jgi:hypothetical protein